MRMEKWEKTHSIRMDRGVNMVTSGNAPTAEDIQKHMYNNE